MSKRHKYGHFYSGKIHKYNKIVQTRTIHGSSIRNGVKWIHMLEIAG